LPFLFKYSYEKKEPKVLIIRQQCLPIALGPL